MIWVLGAKEYIDLEEQNVCKCYEDHFEDHFESPSNLDHVTR